MILIHHSPKFEIDLPFDIPEWMENLLFNQNLKYSESIHSQISFIKTWLKSQPFYCDDLVNELDHRITQNCKLILC